MRLVRADKREPDKVVSGAGVVLFPRVFELKSFQPKGPCVPVMCEKLTVSTAWAWEDRLAVCGKQSLSQEDTEVLYLGRMWGVAQERERSQLTQVWKPSR